MIYNTGSGGETIESAEFSQGRIIFSSSTAHATHYHHRDHLGSVRAITDGAGTTIEQNDYYPFGGRHSYGQTYLQTTANRHKFNGKEEQTIGNLGLLDYGARMYDPAIGRWTAQDPLSEKYYSFSAYNYCVNNPVMFVDLDGRDWYSYQESFIDDEMQLNFVTKYAWTIATSQEELDAAGIEGSYLGEVVVEVNGYYKECFGSKGTMMDNDALAASITIYGKNGDNDIQQYVGLSMSSDYSKYAAINNGEYKMYYQKMASSIYGSDAYTYRISTLQDDVKLPVLGGFNKATGKSFIEDGFFHRTNWDGRAVNSSKACIVIDGRQWRRVEKQLGKSKNIFLKIKRN